MKNNCKFLIIIIVFIGNTLMVTAQALDKISLRQRDSILVATAKEIVMKYGPDYYRDYQPPIIKRFQVPPKGDSNPDGKWAGRIGYNVVFLYDDKEEQLEYKFAASVDFWEDTGKPNTVFFGNGWGRLIRDNWRTDTTIEPTPYQEMEVLPIYDWRDNPNPSPVPKNLDELKRHGYEQRSDGQWEKVRPDIPPGKRKKVDK